MGCLFSILLLMISFGFSASMASQVSVAPSLPRPLVMLREIGEASFVSGSVTTFVLYDTGQVIFVHYAESLEYELASVMLDDDAVEALLETLDIGDEFYALDDYYAASEWTDQTTSEICVSDAENGDKCVSVYGDLRISRTGTEEYQPPARMDTPVVFLTLFDALVEFDHPDAETWLPEVFRVTIWEFDTRTNRIVELPAEFEALFDPTGQWQEESYVIYVDREQYEYLRVAAPGSSVVLIDGRTWAFDISYPYPHEETPDLQTVP